MKLWIASLILSLCVQISIPPEYIKPETAIETETEEYNIEEAFSIKATELYAKGAVLIDGTTGRVLYEKNGYEVLPMASTTKIMTCIIILENANLDDVVTVSRYAASMPDVQLNVREGEQFYVRDLLYSLMLESHNDSSVALAEHVGGSVQGFARLMNQKARDLGCFDTYFITPNGLDSQDEEGKHSTTAVDLARIMSYCIQNEEFVKICQTRSYQFQNISGDRSFSVNNKNAFLDMMEGVICGKTGFTNQAGYCYVGALEQDGRIFIVALLACGWPNNKTYKWSDTKKLMNYGLSNYQYRDVFKRDIQFQDLIVLNGIPSEQEGQEATVKIGLDLPEDEQSLILLLREDEKVNIQHDIIGTVEAPVNEHMVLGTVKYYMGDDIVKTYPVYALESVKKIDWKWCFMEILKKWCDV